MPEIRHIISKAQAKELWSLKDRLEVLSKNPLTLHKKAFLEYLRVKGEMLYAEAQTDADIKAADIWLTHLSVQWKEEAKAINERRAKARAVAVAS